MQTGQVILTGRLRWITGYLSHVQRALRPEAAILLSGLALLGLFVSIARLSPRFYYGGDPLERPIVLMTCLLIAAGFVYMLAVAFLLRAKPGRKLLAWVLGVGLGLRALLFFSSPILEDDYYRYLWDGGVSAHGYNPYAYIPRDVAGAGEENAVPRELHALGKASGRVLARVNHDGLGTVYPPVAQAAFALAHWLRPWSLTSWRAVLFLFELAVLGLLLKLLARMGKPLHFAALYWWNPLVIKETVNSAHMDVVVLPFVLLALLFALDPKPLRTGVALAFAIAAKIWPILLIPPLVRACRVSWRKRGIAAGVFLAVLVLLLSPMLAVTALGEESGFFAYGERWEMNDALFMAVHKACQWAFAGLGHATEGRHVDFSARMAVLILLVLWVGRLSYRKVVDPEDLCNRLVLIAGALFLLSPAQFPWYYLWLVPLLTLSPRPSLLVLTIMLPIYYLKFHFTARGQADFFHNGVVWIEYAPTFALLLWEGWTARRAPSPL